MPYAVELSGEHAPLARAEAHAAALALGGSLAPTDLDRLALASDVDPAALVERLAFAWRVVDVAARTPAEVDAIVDAAPAVDVDVASFAVRCSRLDPDHPPERARRIETELGRALAERGAVDLEEPERVVRVLLDREAIVGLEVARVDRSSYEDRHVEKRPDHQPVTLHPRLARALVNLGRAPPGGRVWDPFAGTGGIALEAALAGLETVASDADAAMVEATRATLAHFDAEAEVRRGDVAELADQIGPVDAVVTDPPYGRASSTGREDRRELYERFLAAARRALEPGGRLACPLPNPADAERAPEGLAPVDRHAWRVHASLTRHVTVFERTS